MAKSDPKKEPELHPDAWARFERAVDVVAKSPPQHRVKAKKSLKRKKKAPAEAGPVGGRYKAQPLEGGHAGRVDPKMPSGMLSV
jgi:hypothetical protein